ncbi:nuclear transport factor 2 family protein [Halochromatium sp.]
MLLIASVLLVAPAFGQGIKGDVGERLVNDLWQKLASGNLEALEAMMAEDFQAAHQDGVQDRSQELALIKKLDSSDYSLSNFSVSRQGDALLVSYYAQVGETISGERLKQRAPRMDIFVSTDGDWKWLGHANLAAMKN